MKNRRSLLTILLLITVLVLSACGNGKNNAVTPVVNNNATNAPSKAVTPDAPKLEKRELMVGSARDPQLASELIVAMEQGYFEKEGLKIDLQLFQTGADLTAAIAGKSILMGSAGDAPSTILKASGNSIQIIAQQADISGTQALVVNKVKIKTPADLNGKKVAYSQGNTSEALFLKIVEKYKLDVKSMDIYKMGPTEMLPAFQRGDVDAFVVWEPSVLNAEKQGGMKLLSASKSFVSGEEGPQKLLGAHSLLIADSDFVRKNPETTKAVLRALIKAVDFIKANPDQAAKVVAKKLGADEANVKKMMDLNIYSLVINKELVEDIQAMAAFLNKNGKIKAVPDYAEFINTSILKELDKALVTWTP